MDVFPWFSQLSCPALCAGPPRLFRFKTWMAGTSPAMTNCSVMILEALGELFDILRRPARHFHAEMQAHLRQHFLDLVERLASEVRRAEHLRFALLHEVADVDDV